MVTGEPPTVDPGARLSRSLDGARERGFVGRRVEVDSFAELLSGASESRVLFVHGPGGIGKTTLLDALARRARGTGRLPLYLDARDVACSGPEVVAAITRRAAGLGARRDVEPDVLLIDGYELLEPLDRWFREDLLPARPAGSLTVLAGRSPPQPGWRLDPGWRRLLRVHELAALSAAESDELLALLGVTEPARATLAGLGRGHPLVLAMLAETGHGATVPAELADAPDVVGRLCHLIIDDIPDAAHRAALATCAHATRMTEDLLARTVGVRAPEVWAWLESRPYVRRGAIGLFLHDVVRELFEAEFAQRSPDAYVALHRTVRGYFIERLVDPAEPHPDRAAAEILLLHRRSPLAGPTAALREGGLPAVSRAGPEDHAAILSLIAGGEGSESADLAARWMAEQPGSVYRVRSDDGVEGFAIQVYLPTESSLLTDDPAAVAVMRAVDEAGPLRPGERVNVNRFAGTSGLDRRDPMLFFVNGVSCLLEWATQPAAWTFIVTVDSAYYGPYFEYLGMRRMVHVDYWGHDLVGYGWDRRRFPTTALFELMARRELSGESGPPPADMMRPAPLSRSDFAAAVRNALPQLGCPDRLAESALLGTALVDQEAPDPVAALRAGLLATVRSLGAERRGAEHCRVLERTYVKGARSQEVAAELLGLPFSTYRRHLARAQERLVEVLWSVEVGERRLPEPSPGSGQEVGTD